jgi:hypothetical protein
MNCIPCMPCLICVSLRDGVTFSLGDQTSSGMSRFLI